MWCEMQGSSRCQTIEAPRMGGIERPVPVPMRLLLFGLQVGELPSHGPLTHHPL